MAREVVLGRGGKTSTFGMTKVDRKKLYGQRKRLPVGPDGEVCKRASLTEDGSMLLLSGMTAQGYFTEGGTWVPNKELVGMNAEGETVEKVPSTLGVEQELEGPVNPSDVLDLRIQSVYGLDAKDVDDDLLTDLKGGQVFRFLFNYRADYRAEKAYLVANGAGEVFALIGHDTEPVWQDVSALLPVFDDDDGDDDDDDLDFEMF